MDPVIHGRSITAAEVESIVSREFTPQRFASLCNVITWVTSGRRRSGLPLFTERVNAKDGGIDAEWQMELPGGDSGSPLMGPGWNVSQYKQRDVFALGRSATFRGLAAGLEGAIREVKQRTERQPAKYVLFTNLDLTHFTKGQKGKLKQGVQKGSKQKIPIEIVGAAELATLLNGAPHLRSAFFAAAQFSTWQVAWDAFMRSKLFGGGVKLVGRDDDLSKIQSHVDDPKVRAIVLTGPHNIGKSRLALQACERRPLETVVALDPRSMTVGDTLALASPTAETVVIVEDPDFELAEDLVEHVLVNQQLKLVITLPTPERAPAPSFGRDGRVQTVSLAPLSDAQSEELLRAAGARFDFGLESWVVSQAGGNPGILLFAASLGPDLRRTAATFTEDVGRAFEHKVARVLGEATIFLLQLLSLLTHVGVSGQPAKELELVCRLFGDDATPHAILELLHRFIDAGVVRSGGQYVEVAPPPFADRLARSALRGRFGELCSLFGGLSQAWRLRLIRRLQRLKTEETEAFWAALFGVGGLFENLSISLQHERLLRLVAATVPAKTAALISAGLRGTTVLDRREIRGDSRRALMWALEELLFRDGTSRAALECLAMLAEAENETWSNNATGVFSECFHPLHPQMPLPLDERIDVLSELFAEGQSEERKLLGVKAIETALGYSPAVMLRRSDGLEPLGTQPPLTYGQIWDYIDALAEHVMKAVLDRDAVIVIAASRRMPHLLAEAALRARPEAGMARLTRLVDWAISSRLPLEIGDVSDEIERVREEFERRHDGATVDERARLDALANEAEALTRRLEDADYGTRLKRWIGKWSRGDHDQEVDEQGQMIYRGEKEIRQLAREAVEAPEKLTDEVLAWLSSGSAQKAHMFAWWLGRLDRSQFWREKVERCGSSAGGAGVFASYFGGVAQNDREFVSRRLDALAGGEDVTGTAIVSATGYLGGDLAGIERTVRLLRSGRADPGMTAKVLMCGGWIQPLAQGDYLRLIQAIGGQGLEHAMAVIDFLGMWLYNRKPIEGELAAFAWRCLETLPRGSENQHYDCDHLAAQLAPSDPERGFRLLEATLTRRYDRENWNPLRNYGDREFWSVLLELDRTRTMRLVLTLALGDERSQSTITWDLREIVEQERDADVLIAFALEGQRKAELIANSVSTAQPGFWPIATRLIEAYPKNERIQGRLADAAAHMGTWIAGPMSAHNERCRREVQKQLADSTLPATTRGWLRRLEASFREQAEKELLKEIEDNVNEVRRIVDRPDAPERAWAVGTLLRLGKVREALAIAERRELLRCLSELAMPRREKARLRRMLDELSATSRRRRGQT